MNQTADIDLCWGGYYLTRPDEHGRARLFRLLDFDSTAYHAALYSETFADAPALDEVKALTPLIGHAPIDVRGLLDRAPLRLLGEAPLTRDDLTGYEAYLEHHGLPPEDQEALLNRVIQFSHQPPLRLRLELVGDELRVTERN